MEVYLLQEEMHCRQYEVTASRNALYPIADNMGASINAARNALLLIGNNTNRMLHTHLQTYIILQEEIMHCSHEVTAGRNALQIIHGSLLFCMQKMLSILIPDNMEVPILTAGRKQLCMHGHGR